MVKKILIMAALINAIMFEIKAQTVPSPSEAYLNMELINSTVIPDEVLDTLTNPMNIVASTDVLKISLSMLLVDTNVVNKIHIKLGTTSGGTDLLEQTFNYDTNLILPQSYFREEEMVSIVFGEYINSSVFYCQIILEDIAGNLSEIINCNSGQ